MNAAFITELKNQLNPFLSEMGFKLTDEDIYLKEDYATKIEYNDDKNLFVLLGAKPKEEEELKFVEISSYLFDDNNNEKDLKSVAIDFEESLREELGTKRQRANNVALPKKAEKGETPTIEAFTKGFLDFFPTYKEAYKLHVETNGSFLYVNFYLKYGIEKMTELATNYTANDKILTKYINYLEKMYENGDMQVTSLITTILFGGSFYDKKDLFEKAIIPKLENQVYLKQAAVSAVENASKSKKLQKLFNQL